MDETERDKELYYKMSNKRRGYAIIFNHERFDQTGEEKLGIRKGTEVDCDRLENCLKNLGFKVFVFHDLIKLHVYEKLAEFSQKNHSKNDCFLVAVLTHGSRGKLHAYDESYKCEELWSPFYKFNCPSLKGKPKIFIIQACQGTLLDHGVTLTSNFNHINNNNNIIVNTTIGSDDEQKSIDYFPYQPIQECDFLVVFSTPPDHFSWRNVERGSWFIRELCKELEENAYKEHLLHLLINVSRLVAENYESYVPYDTAKHKMKQVPFCCNTFLKICKFNEKRKRHFFK